MIQEIKKLLNEGGNKTKISCLIHGLFAAFLSVLGMRYLQPFWIVWSIVTLVGYIWEYYLQGRVFKNSYPIKAEFLAFPIGSSIGLFIRELIYRT